LVLHQVPVVSIQGSSNSGDKSAPQPSATKLLVTVALSEPAAENLVWAMEHGTIWLSLEPKGADPSKTRIVTNQNAFQ
jgi:pilus assembly protein CpaB